MVSAGLGPGIVFEWVPSLQIMLKFAGSDYLLYRAGWFLFSKTDGGTKEGSAKAPTYLQGVILQFVNPKASIMILTAASVYTLPGDQYIASLMLIVLIFSRSIRALFGTLLGRLLKERGTGSIVRILMAAFIAASVLFILL